MSEDTVKLPSVEGLKSVQEELQARLDKEPSTELVETVAEQQITTPAPPTIEQKPLTFAELKSGYVEIPYVLFTRKVTCTWFGGLVLAQLRTTGLQTPSPEKVKLLGYVFCGGFTPVEIAVYGYLCAFPDASLKEIAKRRCITPRLASRTIESLVEAGLVEEQADGRRVATLEELLGGQE